MLRHLHEQLAGQPISIVLTDANGLVLLRFTGDRDLERQLDAIRLAPGFCYAEDVVGTNGIGTALESGGPAHVFGHEHYAERLEGLACAGAPVRDPMSGKTVGVLDLTCRRGHADSLMISLARSAADQLGQALAEAGGGRNLRLLQEYAKTCRHTGGIVLALGNDVVMLNDHARQALSPADQAELISQATEALGRQPAGAVMVDLPGGMVARMFCHPLLPTDGVFHVKLVRAAVEPSDLVAAGSMSLPGLVGKGAAWRRAWQGNAAQLRGVLRQVVQRRRVGQILPADLPPECWTVSRRVLSPLESIERDAIVASLLDHGGNKIRVARALGMSRATVYRRIHEYGIVTPPGA